MIITIFNNAILDRGYGHPIECTVYPGQKFSLLAKRLARVYGINKVALATSKYVINPKLTVGDVCKDGDELIAFNIPVNIPS